MQYEIMWTWSSSHINLSPVIKYKGKSSKSYDDCKSKYSFDQIIYLMQFSQHEIMSYIQPALKNKS